jgi:hypothetical protein
MTGGTEYDWEWLPDALMVFWVLLLVPWFFVWGLFGMVSDAGPSFLAYLFVASVWSYPVSVVLAATLRDRKPIMVFLPCLNGLGFLFAAMIDGLKQH